MKEANYNQEKENSLIWMNIRKLKSTNYMILKSFLRMFLYFLKDVKGLDEERHWNRGEIYYAH